MKLHALARAPIATPRGHGPRLATGPIALLAALAVTAVSFVLPQAPARADEPTVVTLSLRPALIDDVAQPRRLLPADPDLKPGNAAVVLLRMPWEQLRFMSEWYTTLAELASLPPDDPRVAELPFDRFANQMRRAAFMRDADWAYPIDDEPLDSILLPDVQGLRQLVGHGMTVWVNQRLAKGELDAARAGILAQVACARHVARTPFMVNQFVAAAIAEQGLDGVERLVCLPGSPNLHGGLSLLPATLGRDLEAVQLESVFTERSLDTLRGGFPAPGDGPAWSRVMDEWLTRFSTDETVPAAAALSATRARIAAAGRESFAARAPADLDLATASADEIGMRFILDTIHRTYAAAEAAWRREPPEAIDALVAIGADFERFKEISSNAGLLPPMGPPIKWYLGTHRFGRRARMLAAVEALRDAAARNGNRFPATLADVPAHVPHDPFTGLPFVYEPAADGRSARLATPPIPGVDEPRYSRIYELTITNGE